MLSNRHDTPDRSFLSDECTALIEANSQNLQKLFRGEGAISRDRLSFAEMNKTFRRLKLIPNVISPNELKQLSLKQSTSAFGSAKSPPPLNFEQFKNLVKDVAFQAHKESPEGDRVRMLFLQIRQEFKVLYKSTFIMESGQKFKTAADNEQANYRSEPAFNYEERCRFEQLLQSQKQRTNSITRKFLLNPEDTATSSVSGTTPISSQRSERWEPTVSQRVEQMAKAPQPRSHTPSPVKQSQRYPAKILAGGRGSPLLVPQLEETSPQVPKAKTSSRRLLCGKSQITSADGERNQQELDELQEFVKLEQKAKPSAKSPPPPGEINDMITQALNVVRRQRQSLTVYHQRSQISTQRSTPQSLIKQSRSFSPDRAMTSLGTYVSPARSHQLSGPLLKQSITSPNTARDESEEEKKEIMQLQGRNISQGLEGGVWVVQNPQRGGGPVQRQYIKETNESKNSSERSVSSNQEKQESTKFLQEMRQKAKQFQEEKQFDVRKLAEDMKKKFEGAGTSINSREGSLKEYEEISDQRVQTMSSQENNPLNISAVKVSRIDLTLSQKRNVNEQPRQERSRNREKRDVSLSRDALNTGGSQGKFGPVLGYKAARKEVELTKKDLKHPLSPRQKSVSVRSNPHHQQSQLVRGLKVHQQTLNKLETSPRIKQKIGRKPPTPAVGNQRELKVKGKIIWRLLRRIAIFKNLRKALSKWKESGVRKRSKLIGGCLLKGWAERMMRRKKEAHFRQWQRRVEHQRQEWLKGEYVKVRMVAMGAHWAEHMIEKKRRLGRCFGVWKRQMYMTRTNSTLSKRLEQIVKMSCDLESTID